MNWRKFGATNATMSINKIISKTQAKLALAMRRRRLQKQFQGLHGYKGNFEHPRTFEEKIHYRKLYGNHEFYSTVADKYRVREYVAQRVGSQYLIPLLGVYDRLTPAVFDTLPNQFIIKANHGCKWHKIVEDKETLDVPATIEYFNNRIDKRFGKVTSEFHYSLIEPKIVIEELLTDDRGVLANYELFCFHGKNGFNWSVDVVLQQLKRSIELGENWEQWERNGGFSNENYTNYVQPKNSEEMIHVAKALSADFDFVRIDLYNIQGRIYFGEITCTPGAGLKRAANKSTTEKIGNMWHLNADDPQLYQKR